jgi:hypothetical protein
VDNEIAKVMSETKYDDVKVAYVFGYYNHGNVLDALDVTRTYLNILHYYKYEMSDYFFNSATNTMQIPVDYMKHPNLGISYDAAGLPAMWSFVGSYGEPESYEGPTLLLTEERYFDTFPERIKSHYTETGSYDYIHIYYADGDYINPYYTEEDYDANIVEASIEAAEENHLMLTATVENIGNAPWYDMVETQLRVLIDDEDGNRGIIPADIDILQGNKFKFEVDLGQLGDYSKVELVMLKEGEFEFGNRLRIS